MENNVGQQGSVSGSTEIKNARPIPDVAVSSPTVSCVATISINWLPGLDHKQPQVLLIRSVTQGAEMTISSMSMVLVDMNFMQHFLS